MIIGIGTDIVAVERMRESIESMGDKFPKRLLTAFEYTVYCEKKNGPAYLAKRFAANIGAISSRGRFK